MQVSVETTKGLERRMTIEVPADRIDQEIQSRLVSLAKKAKMHGFRPGKVPINVVKRQYGSQIQGEVNGAVIQSSFSEAVQLEKLRPVGVPTIEPKPRRAGESLEYTAIFEVYPDIKLARLQDMSIEKPAAQISEQDIDEALTSIRRQHQEWIKVERSAQRDDRVKIDFNGTIDGKTFAGGKGEDMPVDLGSNRMVQGFEENIEGLARDEERTFEVQFPEDYHQKQLAGKQVQFWVKVNSVAEGRLPALDEKLFQILGVTEGGLEALREGIKNKLQRTMEERIKTILKQNVIKKILEIFQIEVPNTLIDKEIVELKSATASNMESDRSGKPAGGVLDPAIELEARRQVTLRLILMEIIKQNNIEAKPEKVKALVEDIALAYDRPQEVVQWYYADKERLAKIESLALEDAVVEWIAERANISRVETTFGVLMGVPEVPD